MTAVTLTADDLTPFAAIEADKAAAMIADVLAVAARVAPCITTDDFAYPDAAKAVLRGVVLRWNESGSGALQSETVGPYSMSLDTRQPRRGLFWPSEIEQLQDMCKGDETAGVFSVDTLGCATVHADICALYFGATYCSCGADIAGWPLYETETC